MHILFAQLTIAIAGCLVLVGRVSRWRPAWLAFPAVGGLAWLLADGVRPSVAAYLASGGHLVAHLAKSGARAGGLAALRSVLAGWHRWLPAQLPVAVPVAAAEAALITLLGRRGQESPDRPGLLVAARRCYLAWSTARGELATADGGCVGIAWNTGRRAAISWREAEGGVLCAGRDAATVTATGLALTLAAIAHRKAVLVIDLVGGAPGVGGAGPAEVIESACADAAAPLRRFGGARGCYDPLASAETVIGGQHRFGPTGLDQHSVGQDEISQHDVGQHHTARLVLAMIDWAGVANATQLFCAEVVNVAMAVIAARPRQAASVIDELARLLQPGVLRVRGSELSGQSPVSDWLVDHVIEVAGRLDAEPTAVAPVVAHLEALRGDALGRWLRRAGREEGISLCRALADREVVLFSLDRARGGRAAAMIARLALADLSAILAERAEIDAPADCLVWVNGCEAVTPSQLAGLVAGGERSGTAVVLGTAADSAAASLVADVNVIAIRGQAPPSLQSPGWAEHPPGRPAELPSQRLAGVGAGTAARTWARATSAGSGQWSAARTSAGPARLPERASLEMKDDSALPARLLAGRDRDALSLFARSPRSRLLTGCRALW